MRVVIFGCGGHARSVANTLCEDEPDVELLFVDENAGTHETIWGFNVLRKYELQENDDYIVAIGDNNKRSKLYESLLKNDNGNVISVVSKHAYVGMNANIGRGTFVAPNAYIGPQAAIGDNTIINTGSIIEHETIIGSSTHIAPHATVCGRTSIGNRVFCGAGSVVIDSINVCDDALIGAGAVVRRDIMEPGTYAGVPAEKRL